MIKHHFNKIVRILSNSDCQITDSLQPQPYLVIPSYLNIFSTCTVSAMFWLLIFSTYFRPIAIIICFFHVFYPLSAFDFLWTGDVIVICHISFQKIIKILITSLVSFYRDPKITYKSTNRIILLHVSIWLKILSP